MQRIANAYVAYSSVLSKHLSSMINNLEPDSPKIFDEHLWIQTGNRFDTRKLPLFVLEEFKNQIAVPPAFLDITKLPTPQTTVSDVVNFDLPRISSEISLTKTNTWISHENPTTNPSILLTRLIPSETLIDKLHEALGQAWLDGAKSIVDPRFNNGQDRFPLWVISYWKHVSTLSAKQKRWKSAIQWLDNEMKKPDCSLQRKGELKSTLTLLDSLEWDSETKFVNQVISTIELSRLLGTLWLSDDHMNMMMEDLTIEKKTRTLPSGVQIATLWFANQVGRVGTDPDTAAALSKNKVFQKYEEDAREERVEQLYFPLHVNENNWVAGLVDFARKRIMFGESIIHR